MSKEEQNEAVPMYNRVVDNSVDYVAPSAGPEQQAPPAAKPEGDQPQARPEGDQPQVKPEGDQPQAKPEGDQQVGAPGYIQEIQAQLAEINQQMAAGKGAEGPANDPMVQLEQQLADLQQKAEDGEITYSEMIRQTAPLIEQRATMKVKQDLQQEEEAKQIRGAQDAFLAENPDFMDFVKSPEAQAIRQANPILDNVSAYYAFKAKTSEAAIGSLQQQFNELKQQMESSIKGAAQEQAPAAGTGQGDDTSIPKVGKGDGLKPFEGGMAALRRARAAQ